MFPPDFPTGWAGAAGGGDALAGGASLEASSAGSGLGPFDGRRDSREPLLEVPFATGEGLADSGRDLQSEQEPLMDVQLVAVLAPSGSDTAASLPEAATQLADIRIRVTEGQGLHAEDAFRVTVTPVNDARNHPHSAFSPAPRYDAYDFNRDKKVDTNDEIISRNNAASAFTRLQLITAPAAGAARAALSPPATDRLLAQGEAASDLGAWPPILPAASPRNVPSIAASGLHSGGLGGQLIRLKEQPFRAVGSSTATDRLFAELGRDKALGTSPADGAWKDVEDWLLLMDAEENAVGSRDA